MATPISSVDEARNAFASHHFILSLIENHDKAELHDKPQAMRVLAAHINSMFEHYNATPLSEAADTLELNEIFDEELSKVE